MNDSRASTLDLIRTTVREEVMAQVDAQLSLIQLEGAISETSMAAFRAGAEVAFTTAIATLNEHDLLTTKVNFGDPDRN